jgi:hypothetical protein
MRTKSAKYYRSNPLSDTELVVGGLVAAAVVGIGGYLIYQHYNAPVAATAALPAPGTSAVTSSATPAGYYVPTAPYDPSNPATYGGPGTPSSAVPPST